MQSNIVANNKKYWLKKIKEKNGNEYFKIDIGHNIFNLLFLILNAIIKTNIVVKKFKIIKIITAVKYMWIFSLNRGVKWKYLKILDNSLIKLSCFQIVQNYII